MTDIFSEVPEEKKDETIVSDQVIGENGRYKTTELAAAALVEKDRFIAQLKEENRQAREVIAAETAKNAKADEILQELLKVQPPANQPAPARPSEQEPGISKLSDKDLASRIREVTSQVSQEEKQSSNLRQVASTLIGIYGDKQKAEDAVNQKAIELGVSPSFLHSTAGTSPQAFAELMGLKEPPKSTPGVTSSQADTFRMAKQTPTQQKGPVPDTYSYFQEMMKSDPAQYFSPVIQNKMHKLQMENPEKFGVPS